MHNLINLAAIASLLVAPASAQTVISAVILTRHGARTPLFKDTKTFAEGNSQLTIEGKDQLFERGTFLHSRWSSGPNAMTGWSDTYQQNTTYVRSSDTDRTINSADSLLLALFPAPPQTLKLANGTTLTSPTNDQQVPIHVVQNDQDYVLRGWFNCTKLDQHTTDLFASQEFITYQTQHQALLDALSPRYGRPLGLSDMWNVFDDLNVQKSYNASFKDLTQDQWTELTQLLNYLEYQKFKVGYAAANFVNDVVTELQADAQSGATRKLTYYSGHYTTFTNFFGLTGLSTQNTSLQSIPDYGSLLIFELLQDTTNPAQKYVRFSYRNGQSDPVVYAFPSLSAMPKLEDFVAAMKPLGASGLKGWCNVCGNTVNRGCETLQGAAATGSEPAPSGGVSPAVGGVIGAVVGVVVTAILAGVLWHVANKKRAGGAGYAAPESVPVSAGSSTSGMVAKNVV
ncbi:hypothetical protein HDV00_009347 [Rhizophlyctis rosea]|nr:hypothetical protein HDV00_009347 [Rhizophlyctis rosea]